MTPRSANYPNTLEIHHAGYEEGLTRLAAGIKSTGAGAAIQLFHPGRQMHPKYTGNSLVAPSAIPCPVMKAVPSVLSATEIRRLVADFVAGAVRAKRVGFDAVEIHAAHGYLGAQFLSPLSNHHDMARFRVRYLSRFLAHFRIDSTARLFDTNKLNADVATQARSYYRGVLLCRFTW